MNFPFAAKPLDSGANLLAQVPLQRRMALWVLTFARDRDPPREVVQEASTVEMVDHAADRAVTGHWFRRFGSLVTRYRKAL